MDVVLIPQTSLREILHLTLRYYLVSRRSHYVILMQTNKSDISGIYAKEEEGAWTKSEYSNDDEDKEVYLRGLHVYRWSGK